MKKITKYITAAALAVWLFCLTAISANAYTEGYFRYEVTDGVITITEYFGREENVTVPNMIAGTPVSVIGENVFPEGSGVKTVNLPDTIMKIHESSFAGGITVVYESNIKQTTDLPITDTPEETAPAQSGTDPAVTADTSAEDKPSSTTEVSTEDSSVQIAEDTPKPDNATQTVPDVGEGGMEEVESGTDAAPDMSGIPDYIEILPSTAATEADTSPAEATESGQGTASTESNPADTAESGQGTASEVNNSAGTAESGQETESEEAPAEKPQDSLPIIPIICVCAAVVVAAAIIIFVKLKKK